MPRGDGQLSAYAPQITSALVDAREISLTNVPELPGTNLIALDCSASMRGATVGDRVAFRRSPSQDQRRRRDPLRRPRTGDPDREELPGLDDRPRARAAGPLRRDQLPADLHDRDHGLRPDHHSERHAGLGWDHPVAAFHDYKLRTGADPKVYSFDLNGYGTLQFPEANVYALAGCSEMVFELIPLLEQDRSALVEAVKNYNG